MFGDILFAQALYAYVNITVEDIDWFTICKNKAAWEAVSVSEELWNTQDRVQSNWDNKVKDKQSIRRCYED